MGNKCSKYVDKNKPWVKCLIAVNVHTQKALLEVPHDPQRGGISSDPQKLYVLFAGNDQQDIIKELRKKRVPNDKQVAILLQQNQRTYSSK